jgi:DNA-binding transcriptional MerR regulator
MNNKYDNYYKPWKITQSLALLRNTLSVTADLSGIPAHSIRRYIDKGLMIPFKKESSRNLFSEVDILRLKFIHKLLDEGGLNIAGNVKSIVLFKTTLM